MQAKPKVDWTKVRAGTMIHIRDNNGEEWGVREFIRYVASSDKPFVCKSVSGGVTIDHLTYWRQAELIKEQPSVKFEGDNVLVPVTTCLTITASEYGLIQSLYPNNRVSIIKYIREVHKFGLVETKKICDTICGLNT